MKKEKAKEKLTEYAQMASDEESNRSFMDPASPKRGRGRPRKIETLEAPAPSPAPNPEIAVQQQIENNKQLVRPLLGLISDAGVKYAGTKDAAIEGQTMAVLVDSAALCIHQYLPDMLGRHAPLILFSLTFTQWSMRVWLLRQQEAEKARAQGEFLNPSEVSNKATDARVAH